MRHKFSHSTKVMPQKSKFVKVMKSGCHVNQKERGYTHISVLEMRQGLSQFISHMFEKCVIDRGLVDR